MEDKVKKDILNIEVPNKPEYVGVVRLTTSAIANRMGFNVDDIDDIKVAVAEACTNILENCLKDINYKIEYTLYEKELSIVVKGRVDNTEAKDDESSSREGELGVFIIQALMDEVEFLNSSSDSIEIRMTKRIEDVA